MARSVVPHCLAQGDVFWDFVFVFFLFFSVERIKGLIVLGDWLRAKLIALLLVLAVIQAFVCCLVLHNANDSCRKWKM